MTKRSIKDIKKELNQAEAVREVLPIRVKVLEDGINLTSDDRDATYGDPVINLECQMRLWKIFEEYGGVAKYSEAHSASMQHIFAKIARIACGTPGHRDNYVDLSTYSGIAFECSVRG